MQPAEPAHAKSGPPVLHNPTAAEIEANKSSVKEHGMTPAERTPSTKSMTELLPEKPTIVDGYAVVGHLKIEAAAYGKFREAMVYESKNPEMTGIVESLEKGPRSTRVDTISSPDNEMQPQLDGSAIVKWDPSHMHIASNGAKRSPATRLAHELDHADEWTHEPQRLLLNSQTSDEHFANCEERRVITGTERRNCKALGEGQREDHDHGKGDFEVAGVTSTTPILHVERNGAMTVIRDGYQQNGKLAKADENFVYQDVGRGQMAKYPRMEFEDMVGGFDKLKTAIESGEKMAVTVKNNELSMAPAGRDVARETANVR